MDSVPEMVGAGRIVETNLAITPDETVLIISDWGSADVGERIAAAAKERGADVVVTVIDAPSVDGGEPSAPVAEAAVNADVIISPISHSIGHSRAIRDALDSGARFLSMTRVQREHLREGLMYVDYEAARPDCETMAERLTAASRARLSTRAGTELVFALDGRSGNSHTGLAHDPGDVTALNIEANIAPVEGSTTGTVIFDGSIPNFDIGVLDDPVTMEIDDGAVQSIDGGSAATRVEEMWETYDDDAVYNIAQLAVGMNPASTTFTGWSQNDHGVYGSAHVGIGTSSNLGGDTRAPMHFDAMMAAPTLALDGDIVLDEGTFTIL